MFDCRGTNQEANITEQSGERVGCKSISSKQKTIKQTHLAIAKRLTAYPLILNVFSPHLCVALSRLISHTPAARRVLLSFGFKSIQAEDRVCSHQRERRALARSLLIPDAFIKVPRHRVQTLLSLSLYQIYFSLSHRRFLPPGEIC